MGVAGSRLGQLERARSEKAARADAARAKVAGLEAAERRAVEASLRSTPTRPVYELGSEPLRFRERRERAAVELGRLERDIEARDAVVATLRVEAARDRLSSMVMEARRIRDRELELRAAVAGTVREAWAEIVDGAARQDALFARAVAEGLLALDEELAQELVAHTLPPEPVPSRCDSGPSGS